MKRLIKRGLLGLLVVVSAFVAFVWTKGDFVRAVREGKRPDGSGLDPFMPWRAFAKLDDVEVDALWIYLRSVPARVYGSR